MPSGEGALFQIGASLRDARQRLGLELAEVEQATKVRERYLRALEEERFDELPPGGYRKTFLRGYATYLGLDGDAFVDEYVSRFEQADNLAIEFGPARAGGLSVRWLWPVASTAALTIGLVAWLAPSSQHSAHQAPPAPRTAASPRPTAPRPSSRSRTTARPHRKQPVSVVFAAVGGDCWLLIRRGRVQGQPVYQRILADGQVLTLRARTLWVRIGNPAVLTLTVNGHAQTLPAQTGNVAIDRSGTHIINQ